MKQSKRTVFEVAEGEYWPRELSPLIQRYDGWTDGEVSFILLQNCYRFLQDSIQIETDTVNASLARLITGQTNLEFSLEEQAELLQVTADEAYHALNSLDLFAAIQNKTNIKPLKRNPETNRSYAFDMVAPQVPDYLFDLFLFGVISIAENTITDELLQITSKPGVNKNIHLFMLEHLKDEGRHSKIFERILKDKLKNLDLSDKKILFSLFSQYSFYMLNESVAKIADEDILKSFIADSTKIKSILDIVYPVRIEKEIFENNNIGIRLTHFLARVF